jgi:hypothetical protein
LSGKNRLELPVAALLGRPAGGITLDDEQLAQRRILLRTVGQLAGQRPAVQGALPANEVLGFPGRLAGTRGIDRLADDFAGDRRVLFEVGAEGVVHRRLDDTLHLAVAELRLGLPFELRIPHLHADDRGQTFPHVVAAERFGVFFEEIVSVGITVDGAGQRGLEAHQVGAAFFGVDVVRERKEVFRVPVVILQRHFKNQVRPLRLHINRFMQRGLGFVEMIDERDDPALVMEDLFFFLTIVLERDGQALVEKGQLAEPLRQYIETEFQRFKNLAVRLKTHLRAPAFGFAGDGERGLGFAALIPLLEDLAVLPDFQLQPFGQRVHDRDADSVQPAGNRVGALLELAARVQDGEGHFGGGFLLGGMHAGGNAAAVVHDRDAAVDVDRDLDGFTETGHVLVDTVVDDFIDEMVQPVDTGAADVHRRSLPDGVESFENFDLIRAVTVGFRLGRIVLLIVLGHSTPTRMLNTSAGGILASCSSLTYRRGTPRPYARGRLAVQPL